MFYLKNNVLISYREVFMEIDNSYYKKIVYKKNAFEDIKAYIKLNFNNKNILLVSTKSIPAEDVTCLLNSLFCGSENVSHFVSRQGFDKMELDALKNKICTNKYDLLVAFGGGKCCDVVKYFANNFGLQYIVCPTTATSLAFFSNYCINPYDASESFYAEFPSKIFIQEQIIKQSNCYTNIQGLCFLHALRSVYVEGLITDDEKEKYILVGLEKTFNKLDAEQTNILICSEDSNLILMDLMIDFGFFIGLLNREKFYLFNMFCVYEKLKNTKDKENMAGKKMLLCAKTILSTMKRFIELNNVSCFEKINFSNLSEVLKNNNILFKQIENNNYFINFCKMASLKKNYLANKEYYYKIVTQQLLKIREFSKKVRSVYKFGIEIDDDTQNVFNSLAITPFISCENALVDLIASSGLLNVFLA